MPLQIRGRSFLTWAVLLCLFLLTQPGCGGATLTGVGQTPAPNGNPLGPRTLTFVNLCQQSLALAAFGNSDPSGTAGTTASCTHATPAGSPCRCRGDTDCRSNEYCNQVPNRTGTACSGDSDCNTGQGEFCDKDFDPNQPRCSFRLCSYIPADPNGLAAQIQPTVSCTDNSACREGQFCNSFNGTCYALPPDGGNGWMMDEGADPVVLTLPEPWGGRFWARTGCDPNSYVCNSGQCNGCISNGQWMSGECTAADLPTSLHCANTGQNPATLAELNMQSFSAGDFYDVSNVDSGNVSVEIRPDPAGYDMSANTHGVSNTPCTQDSDCNPLFGAHVWRCDTTMGKCVNPFVCGSPGCAQAGKCAASGIMGSLLADCPWDAGGDFAVAEADCPADLQIKVSGTYVGCDSPKDACQLPGPPAGLDCSQGAQDLYGCTGANAQSCFTTGAGTSCCGCPSWAATLAPGSCQNSNTNWTNQVEPLIQPFNTACPTSYSFPYDDAIKLFSCQAKDSSTHLNYTITFCPQNGN